MNTYTRLSDSVCANVDVCNALVYYNVFISYNGCVHIFLKQLVYTLSDTTTNNQNKDTDMKYYKQCAF